MRQITIAGILLAAIITGCASMGGSGSELPTERRARGKVLYEGKCKRCHDLYDPRDHSRAEWQRAVRRYGPRAGLRRSDRPDVLLYLQSNASDSR